MIYLNIFSLSISTLVEQSFYQNSLLI